MLRLGRNTSLVITTGTEIAIGMSLRRLHMACLSVMLMCTGVASRSPWSNEYDPPLDDGTVPSAKLRKLEIAANEAFDTYRGMYVPSASDAT